VTALRRRVVLAARDALEVGAAARLRDEELDGDRRALLAAACVLGPGDQAAQQQVVAQARHADVDDDQRARGEGRPRRDEQAAVGQLRSQVRPELGSVTEASDQDAHAAMVDLSVAHLQRKRPRRCWQ
jgi:hypothetical protein